jgi:outer membrane protein
MITLALAALLAATGVQDPMPRITLSEALDRAAALDPGHVAARGRLDGARWDRRAAWSALALPTVSLQTSATRYSSEQFNPGTATLTDRLVQASLDVSYELFRGGATVHELRRTNAELDRLSAEERRARFAAAFGTESDFYAVLAHAELERVAQDRVRRAEEQLEVARARVITGAAVQTDSLRLVLELTRAQVDQLRQETALRTARIQLGRRVGIGGPVDAAAPADFLPAELLLTEEDAVAEAIAASPRARAAAAAERSAQATSRSARSAYIPQASLFGRIVGFDDSFPPDATTRGLWGVSFSLPVWDGGRREARLAHARADLDAARAWRADEELAVRRDVVQLYQGYVTARATVGLAERGVEVARENLRVEEDRYRSGATTVIDLVTAQVDLSEAQAELVRTRFDARLELAGLEALLGRSVVQQ